MADYQGGSITSTNAVFHVVSVVFHQQNPQQNPYLNRVDFQFIGAPGQVPTAVANSALSNGQPQQVSQGEDFWRAVKDLLNQLYP